MREQPGQIDLLNYLREWVIEDAARYERLAGTVLGRSSARNRVTGDTATTDNVPVVAVFEVPRSAMDAFTTKLRSAPALRSSSYLIKAAEHAEGAGKLLEDGLQLAIRCQVLEHAALHSAERCDFLETKLRESAGVAWQPRSYQAEMRDVIDKVPKAKHDAALDAMRKLREALRERKVDVAAKIVASLPDDEG